VIKATGGEIFAQTLLLKRNQQQLLPDLACLV